MEQKFASLKLAVNHNELKLVKNIMATEKTIHGLVVNFDFRTPEWSELTKTASFIREGKAYLVLLDNVDECFIPWECLESKGTFTVGVFGVADGVRLTTNVLRFNVAEGCACEGDEPAEPSQEIYEQILALCGEANRVAQSVRDDVDAGKLDGADGKDGLTPYIGSNGNWHIGTTDTGVNANGKDGMPGKDGIDGKDGAKGDTGVSISKVEIINNELIITLTNNNVFNLGNVKGADGVSGTNGKDGANGVDGISCTHSWNGTILTIGSASGVSSVDLKGEKGDQGIQGVPGERGETGAQGIQGETGERGEKGETGAQGEKGADGYTPIKGTDYYTSTDKAEIVEEISTTVISDIDTVIDEIIELQNAYINGDVNSLPLWTGGSY